MSAVLDKVMPTAVDLNELFSLTLGDLIEAAPLMPGITKEPCVLQVTHASKTIVVFSLTFFGVKIGHRSLTKNEEGVVSWTSL